MGITFPIQMDFNNKRLSRLWSSDLKMDFYTQDVPVETSDLIEYLEKKIISHLNFLSKNNYKMPLPVPIHNSRGKWLFIEIDFPLKKGLCERFFPKIGTGLVFSGTIIINFFLTLAVTNIVSGIEGDVLAGIGALSGLFMFTAIFKYSGAYQNITRVGKKLDDSCKKSFEEENLPAATCSTSKIITKMATIVPAIATSSGASIAIFQGVQAIIDTAHEQGKVSFLSSDAIFAYALILAISNFMGASITNVSFALKVANELDRNFAKKNKPQLELKEYIDHGASSDEMIIDVVSTDLSSMSLKNP